MQVGIDGKRYCFSVGAGKSERRQDRADDSGGARTGAQVHSSVHADAYYDAVNQAPENAAPGTVRDVLSNIANQLLSGTFPH
jgi:hypothetical protein